MSGSPKMTKRLPLPVFLRSSAMWRSAFMRGFEDGNAPQSVEFGSVGFVVESAGDQHVETGLCGFAGGSREIGTGDGAEFGTDEDGGAFPGA